MTDRGTRRLPVARPAIGHREQHNALDALRSGWISPTGPYVDEFEARFADLCGAPYALAVTSGTAALHLALASLGLEPGAEVIVPTLTYAATANAVRYMGAEPVFVDVDPQTWCLDPTQAAHAITPRTSGIIAVDLYGYPADMTSLHALADAHGIWVVEDAAEAIGARYEGRPVGATAHLSAFSFYGNKIVSCGQGGALTLDDRRTYLRARKLRDQGRTDGRNPYEVMEVGFNYGLSNVSCAILCAQLDRLGEMMHERRDIIVRYEAALSHSDAVGTRTPQAGIEIAPWLTAVTIGAGISSDCRDELAHSLAAAGIETRPFFPPLHLMAPYSANKRAGDLSTSLRLAHAGINLPTYVGLADEDIDTIARHALDYLRARAC